MDSAEHGASLGRGGLGWRGVGGAGSRRDERNALLKVWRGNKRHGQEKKREMKVAEEQAEEER